MFDNYRMFGRENHGIRAKDRIDAGGEYADVARAVVFPFRRPNFKIDVGALAAADPIPLSFDHVRRPAGFDILQIIEQLAGVVRYFQEPLLEVFFCYGISATPAKAAARL